MVDRNWMCLDMNEEQSYEKRNQRENENTSLC